MKNRVYLVRLNHIYGISKNKKGTCRVLTGMFVTANRGASVIDASGDFFAYQKMRPESYFLFHLDGQWYDKDSEEAEEIMARHWRKDNL